MRVSVAAGLGAGRPGLTTLQTIDDEVERAVHDARLLAGHAARNGKLPPDSRVYELLADLEEGRGARSTATVAALHTEIDRLARAIAPTTLKQLARSGSFVGRMRLFGASMTPFVLGFLTLLLTIYLAFQSSQLSQADTALREFQDWQTQQPKEKLYSAWKMYRYERVFNIQQPPLAQLDAYQKLVDSARELVDKGDAIQRMLNESAKDLYVPRFLEGHGPGWLRRFVSRLNGGDATPDAATNLPSSDAYFSAAPASTGAPGAKGPAPDPALGPPPPDPKDCGGDGLVKVANRQPKDSVAEMNQYLSSYDCFLQHLQIQPVQLSYSPWPVIYQTKSKVTLLTVWLLPGLYGLLGSCVYLMRELVLFNAEALTRHTRILTMLSLSLRVALGGLAGIIIGWFWVPSNVGNGVALPPISSIPFGIAFFAGFSIETLFSVLDRIKSSVGNTATRPSHERHIDGMTIAKDARPGG